MRNKHGIPTTENGSGGIGIGRMKREQHFYDGVSPWDDADTILNWNNDASGSKTAVSNMRIAGGQSIGTESGIGTGTNISAGIRIANQLIDSARPNAKKVVIVLSDGFANMYYNDSGYTVYNYNNQDGSEGA